MDKIKPWHIVVAFLLLIVVIILLNWERVQNWLFNTTPSSKSPYDDCINKNKNLADGTECRNCIPDGSKIVSFKGVISNGVCIERLDQRTTPTPEPQPKPEPTAPPVVYRLQVSNPKGTREVTIQDGEFVIQPNAKTIPYNTILDIKSSVNKPDAYFQTNQGWVWGKDVTVIQ